MTEWLFCRLTVGACDWKRLQAGKYTQGFPVDDASCGKIKKMMSIVIHAHDISVGLQSICSWSACHHLFYFHLTNSFTSCILDSAFDQQPPFPWKSGATNCSISCVQLLNDCCQWTLEKGTRRWLSIWYARTRGWWLANRNSECCHGCIEQGNRWRSW